MQKSLDPKDLESVAEILRGFERRIVRLEEEAGLARQSVARNGPSDAGMSAESPAEYPPDLRTNDEQSEDLEFELGLHWFARFGIIALALGIGFLLTFPFEGLPPSAPFILGYTLVGGLIITATILKRSFVLVSRYVMGGGMVLLYFTTLRLYFFSAVPVLDRSLFSVLPLMAVTAVNMVVALRRRSVYLFSFSLVMGHLTALVTGNDAIIFVGGLALAALSVYYLKCNGWRELLVVAPALTYLTHALWAMNNPIAGNSSQLVTGAAGNLFVLHLYALIYAAGNYLRPSGDEEKIFVVLTTALNCAGYYGLLLLLTLMPFEGVFVLHNAIAVVLLLSLATAFWVRERSRYQTFLYSMLGYLALSALILKVTVMPDAFIWLSMQSLVVLSTAIWFRSRFIVVANIFLYITILLAYCIVVQRVNAIGLSFGVVALLSARIMNWQQDRLELRTEAMRNAYLVAAFLAFPYMLFRIVPGDYVSLSWLGVALLYYTLNILVRKQKYRWMGHLTLLLTVLYTSVVGIISLEPTYRIISFLILGMVLLAASLIFTRQRARKAQREKSVHTLEEPADTQDVSAQNR